MNQIASFFFKGHNSALLAIYVVVGLFEIFCATHANTSGELNAYGWIAGILGLVVAAPWYWIPIALITVGGPNLEQHLRLITIVSIITNCWLIYKVPYWDATKKQRSRNPMKE